MDTAVVLPDDVALVDPDHLVLLIADMLDRLIAHNDQIPLSPESLTRFHSRSPPAISVQDYLRRIVKFTKAERACLLITLHYIDQICARLPHFTLSSLTCHRFIIAAIAVASKALCDIFCTNAHYARVGGIPVAELNLLEKELLAAIDWRSTCTPEVLQAYYVNLVRTNSTGKYVLANAGSSSSGSSGSSDSSSRDRESPVLGGSVSLVTPTVSVAEGKADTTMADPPSSSSSSSAAAEPSIILRDAVTRAPQPSQGPTLEQNMAFAALRHVAEETAASLADDSADNAARQGLAQPNPPLHHSLLGLSAGVGVGFGTKVETAPSPSFSFSPSTSSKRPAQLATVSDSPRPFRRQRTEFDGSADTAADSTPPSPQMDTEHEDGDLTNIPNRAASDDPHVPRNVHLNPSRSRSRASQSNKHVDPD